MAPNPVTGQESDASESRPPKKAILFIVGMPRSGTTAIASYVEKQTEFQQLPETHFYRIVGREGRKSDHLPAETTGVEALSRLYAENSYSSSDFLVFLSDFEKVFGSYGSFVIEKTPAHLLSINSILSLQQSEVMIVIRDCEAVCNSLQSMPWNPHGVYRNGLRWLKYMIAAVRAARSADSHRVHLINYDRFKERPDRILDFVTPTSSSGQAACAASVDLSVEPWKAGASLTPEEFSSKRKITLKSLPRTYCKTLNRLGYLIVRKHFSN